MTRRELLGSAGAFIAARRQPNILLILMDDMASNAMGCYGNRDVRTPHLDRLAAGGIRFTSAYVTPQCTPTRATLLSGQYTARNRMWHVIPYYGLPWARVTEPEYRTQYPREAFTLAKGLRAAGYATACLGKWHLTNGEDGNYNSLARPEHYGFDVGLSGVPKEAMGLDRGVDFLTDRAIAFAEANAGRPWFCYLSHHATHRVLSAPAALVEKYRRRGYPETGAQNAVSMACIEHMDASIGRLLEKIDRTNTVVIFLSDNGGVSDTYEPKPVRDGDGWRLRKAPGDIESRPYRAGKGSAYEGGIRVPMIVSWPGVAKAGRVEYTPVHAVDLMPTLFAIGGARAPEGYAADGVSLERLWRSGARLAPRPLYWYMPLYDLRWAATPSAAVRLGDWKLIEYFGDSFDYGAAGARYREGHRLELYDLKRDVGESRNLADAEPARAKRMRQMLHAWIRGQGASLPGTNPRFDAARQFEESRKRL